MTILTKSSVQTRLLVTTYSTSVCACVYGACMHIMCVVYMGGVKGARVCV